jgi:hypothetical protein
MSREQAAAEKMMWEAIGPDAQEDWAVWEAAHDSKILAGLTVIREYRRHAKPETIELTKQGLRAYILKEYEDVPPARCEDVLLAASTIIMEERVANGEA